MKKLTKEKEKDVALEAYHAIEAQAKEIYLAITVLAGKTYDAECEEIDERGTIKIIDGKRYILVEE